MSPHLYIIQVWGSRNGLDILSGVNMLYRPSSISYDPAISQRVSLTRRLWERKALLTSKSQHCALTVHHIAHSKPCQMERVLERAKSANHGSANRVANRFWGKTLEYHNYMIRLFFYSIKTSLSKSYSSFIIQVV